MKNEIAFTLAANGTTSSVTVAVTQAVIAGWTGRDPVARDKHIAELAAIGISPPASTPIYYRCAARRITRASARRSRSSSTRTVLNVPAPSPAARLSSCFSHQIAGRSSVSVLTIPTARSRLTTSRFRNRCATNRLRQFFGILLTSRITGTRSCCGLGRRSTESVSFISKVL